MKNPQQPPPDPLAEATKQLGYALHTACHQIKEVNQAALKIHALRDQLSAEEAKDYADIVNSAAFILRWFRRDKTRQQAQAAAEALEQAEALAREAEADFTSCPRVKGEL